MGLTPIASYNLGKEINIVHMGLDSPPKMKCSMFFSLAAGSGLTQRVHVDEWPQQIGGSALQSRFSVYPIH